MKKMEEANLNREAEDTFVRICVYVTNEAFDIAIFVLAAVFPLFYHNAYYDIASAKFLCYSRCVGTLLVFMLLFAAAMAGIDLRKYNGRHTKDFFSRCGSVNRRKTSWAADAALLAFWLSSGISTLQSDHVYEAFWGNGGRWSGFFLLTLYVVSCLLISHLWKLNGWLLEVFLASGMIMCLVGITDYFRMDVLRFGIEYGPDLYAFTSTMGHINGYTAYVGMVTGFAAAMFLLEKNTWRCIWYYVCLVISFAALITGSSDNAYISLVVVFALLPFVMIENQDGLTRYLLIVAAFFTALQAVAVIDQRFADVVLRRDGLFTVVTDFGILRYLLPLIWIAVPVSWIAERKRKSLKTDMEVDCRYTSRRNRYWHLWKCFLLFAVGIFCLILLDVNVGGYAGRYVTLSNYLVFDDSWGSRRGAIWREAVWLYDSYTPVRKLFGCGPDTLMMYIRDMDAAMRNEVKTMSDNAHNAFLQYLLTIGMTGLAAYVAFLCAAFRKLLKGWKKNPYVLAASLAAACYVAQSAVNLNNVNVMPMMWLMLSVGMAGCR